MPDIDLPEWAECLFEPSRYKALLGGRGGGKSRSIATALVVRAKHNVERILCAREVQKSIKDSVKRLLDDEIERCGYRSFFTSTETEIRGANGSLFVFAGLRGNAAGVKSLEGVTIAWVEEAATISQASLDTLIPTIRAPGSELWFSWNPNRATDPVDALFCNEDGPPPRTLLRKINYDSNPWFPPDLQEAMEYDRGRDIDKWRHVWLGEYAQNSEARVFKNWRVEEFDSPDNVEYRQGADFGFSIDPSVMVRCWLDGTRLYVDHEAYGRGVEIVNLPKLFQAIPDGEKWWTTADTARPETISHLRKHGFPRITPALKGARSLEEGVEFLKSYDIVIHPRCVETIAELSSYSYKVDPLTGLVLPVLEDKNNHCIDALRYAVEGARRAMAGKPKVVSVPIPSQRTAFNRR